MRTCVVTRRCCEMKATLIYNIQQLGRSRGAGRNGKGAHPMYTRSILVEEHSRAVLRLSGECGAATSGSSLLTSILAEQDQNLCQQCRGNMAAEGRSEGLQKCNSTCKTCAPVLSADDC